MKLYRVDIQFQNRAPIILRYHAQTTKDALIEALRSLPAGELVGQSPDMILITQLIVREERDAVRIMTA